jgi:outer membrane protein TolC
MVVLRPVGFTNRFSMRRILSTAVIALLAAPALAAAQQPDTLRLSIRDAVARAMTSSEEVRLAGAQVDVTNAQLGVARSTVLPQLRLATTYTHVVESARAQAVGQIFNQPNTYNVTANFTQSLFQGGRALAGYRSASRLREAAKLTEEDTRAQMTLSVQRAYLNALLSNRLVEIQEANLALADSQVAQVQRFEAAGRSARYDVLRARVQRANIEPLVIQARSDRELAILDLKRLINIPIEQPLALTTAVDESALPAMVDRVEALEPERDRATIRAAEMTAEARRQGIRVARADLLPTVNFFVNTGLQAFPTENRLPSLRGKVLSVGCDADAPPGRSCTSQNGGFFPDRSLGLQFSWSIFDGLGNRSSIDLAQSQARVAELQLAQRRETVALEVAAARAELSRTSALFASNQANVEEASEAYRLARIRFNRGISTQLEVQDAQLALMTAEINQARTVNDLYLSVAELSRSLGEEVPLPPSRATASLTTPRTDDGE